MASADIEKTPIWRDVKSIMESGIKSDRCNMKCWVHTEKEDIEVLKLDEFEETADYANSFGSAQFIHFDIGMGDYAKRIYPYRDILEVTLKKFPQKGNAENDVEGEIELVRYRVILPPGKNPDLTGARISTASLEELNNSQLVTVVMELVDLKFEYTRTAMMTGSTYWDRTVQEVIAAAMGGPLKNIHVDGGTCLEEFHIVPPDNVTPIKDAVIPPMKAALVPTYIQEKLQGVYSSGIGTFFQRWAGKAAWFVYPLFNPLRFDEDVDRAVLYFVTKGRMSGSNITYRKEGKILSIIVTGNIKYGDDGTTAGLNQGDGVRIPSSAAVMNKPAEITDKGLMADRARFNTEITNRQRPDGNQYAKVVAPTSNQFKHFSRLSEQKLSVLMVTWENSNPSLIYPGMPVKCVFMDGEEYAEVKGIVHAKFSTTKLIGNTATGSTYATKTTLTLRAEMHRPTPST